jgi:hypothetical protein
MDDITARIVEDVKEAGRIHYGILRERYGAAAVRAALAARAVSECGNGMLIPHVAHVGRKRR